jgi:rare lipoprotein A
MDVMRPRPWCLLAVLLCVGCSRPQQPSSSVPRTDHVLESREGLASYVAAALDGKKTASGAAFDSNALVAAHPTYPFGTVVRVTSVANGKTVEVRIVDRGPAPSAREHGVIIDLSKAAAAALDLLDRGRTSVRVDVLRWGERPAGEH